MNGPFFIAVLISLAGLAAAQNSTSVRERKSFQFLTVVKFPNDVCGASNSRNGTCYTPDECSQKGGVSSGSCANGYGVCCVFTLQCGKSTSENNTYLVLGATATTPSPSSCAYTICPNNPNICRIRLDFTTFAITGPVTGQVKAAAADVVTGGAIGDCITDTFSVGSPGNKGTPVICGTNTNTHMYVEASQLCNTALFNFGAQTFTRQYDIKVTQYSCQDEMAGPSDCLQYFTGNTGTIQSFNFQTKNNLVTSQTTHLSSQCYTMCFRRNLNKCAICFVPTVTGAAGVANQASFGLSTSASGAGTGVAEVDTNCSTDYLIIPNGQVAGPFNPQTTVMVGQANRFCGRYLNNQNQASNGNSICTFMRPFRVTFKTDGNEAATGAASGTNEQFNAPGGIVGFQLNFNQISC